MSSPPSSAFDGTPRERHSSSNSTSSRPPASSSTSSLPPSFSTPSATNPTTHPISIDALLAQHANAPNPPLAALDQALSERNIFSTQNTQLWKLIEKQRSGYNQVLKELERMRTERDAYKTRLQAAGFSVELAKKDRDKPKSLRPSTSNAAMSIVSENGSLDPRAPMVRHVSDTSGLYSPSLQSHTIGLLLRIRHQVLATTIVLPPRLSRKMQMAAMFGYPIPMGPPTYPCHLLSYRRDQCLFRKEVLALRPIHLVQMKRKTHILVCPPRSPTIQDPQSHRAGLRNRVPFH